MQANIALDVILVATPLAILLINSCIIFLQLIEKMDKPEFKYSILVHMASTILLIVALVLLLLHFGFSQQGMVKWSFLLTALSVFLMIPCAFLMAARLGLLGIRLQKLFMRTINLTQRTTQSEDNRLGEK